MDKQIGRGQLTRDLMFGLVVCALKGLNNKAQGTAIALTQNRRAAAHGLIHPANPVRPPSASANPNTASVDPTASFAWPKMITNDSTKLKILAFLPVQSPGSKPCTRPTTRQSRQRDGVVLRNGQA